MEKWICSVCGYTYQGDSAPDRCPRCGASKAQFYLKNKSSNNIFGILIIILILAVVFCLFTC
ncbi:MAG: hypothetical protein MJZ35_08785 [Bacteroidaceae bacterium]|nr:hypothetical protein [Bacteroidaceae bacterium]